MGALLVHRDDRPGEVGPADREVRLERARGAARRALGIPYAAPPVTERRWHEPELDERWAGELDVPAVGPPPPQPVRPISEFAWGAIPPGREDCLYLNVWTPSSGAGDWPVLVWSIGGGWTIGWTGSGVDDGARLADAAEVVVVTFSYRLGSLGWAFGNWVCSTTSPCSTGCSAVSVPSAAIRRG
jgi:para-nitrobenzyl esterase